MGKKSPARAGVGHRKSRTRTRDEREFSRLLGSVLESRRAAAGITAEELGQLIGSTVATQHRWESGDVSMPIVALYRYAAVFGCTPNDLVRQADRSSTTAKALAKGGNS